MASSLALSGLASGVDTSSIVEQLIALDRQGTSRIQNRQYAVSGMQTALKDIASKLSTLKSAAAALTSDATWKQTPEDRVVRHDARRRHADGRRRHRRPLASRSTASPPRPSAGSRSRAARPGRSRSPTPTTRRTRCRSRSAADTTMQQLADAINAKSTGPVVAAVVKNAANEDRLVLSSRTTGSLSDFNVSGGVTERGWHLRDAGSDQARRRVLARRRHGQDGEDERARERRPGPAHHAQGRRPARRRRSASASPRSTATRSRQGQGVRGRLQRGRRRDPRGDDREADLEPRQRVPGRLRPALRRHRSAEHAQHAAAPDDQHRHRAPASTISPTSASASRSPAAAWCPTTPRPAS